MRGELISLLTMLLLAGAALPLTAQVQLPSGDPADFRVKTCLHSVSYAGFWRGQQRLTVEEFLVKAKELGYDGVLLVAKRPHLSPLDYDQAARAKLRRRIEELGLTLVGLAGYTDFTAGIDRAGIPHPEIQAAYVGELARLARDLGTDMVRVFTGYERSGVAWDKQYEAVLQGLRDAGDQAARYGVTLVVQNHHDLALHHEAMAWLLEEVDRPNVVAAWDAWSPTLEGLSAEEIRQSVHRMKPWLAHTTAADYVRLPRYAYDLNLTNYLRGQDVLRAVPVGEGVIDYRTFIGALKEIGYRGYLAYEMCEVLRGGGQGDNLDQTARKFIEYVRQFE